MAEPKKIVIEAPATEPKETPPEEENQKIRHDGIGLIQAIYDFIVPRDLICFSLVKKYRKIFDLSKLWCKLIYYPFAVICMLTDLLFSIIIDLIILAIFLAISAAFIRGLGVVDWIIPLTRG
jgi:hypothetical protein